MRIQHTNADVTDILVKTTLGCSLIVILILIPFTINNFVQERPILAVGSLGIVVTCCINVWYGLQGKYNLLVNTYLVAPLGTFAVASTLYKLAMPGSYWAFLLLLSYYFVLPEKRAWVFTVLALLIVIPLAWLVLELSLFVRFSAVLLGVALFAYSSMRVIHVLYGLVKEQAVTDKLTGIYNRTLLDDSLQHAIAQSRRSTVPMSLVSFDIDNFKSINDTLGHDIGDRVLQEFADLLKKRVRSSDMVFRVGGDEFLILVYNADELHAVKVAEDFRHEMEQKGFFSERQVTISAGVSALQDDMDLIAWVKSCDEKLYRAKESGRNQVIV